uniref:Intraflagellar transport protein 80 homolog n=1 Tax=Parascaris univalens TaxID=6257 RepID=A0A914ZMI5_PARUN
MLSCGDDQQLLRWNLVSLEAHPLIQLPNTFYPTSMHWFPKGQLKQSSNDIFVLSSTEGKFYVYNRSGRLEKIVDAHKGATLCARWSYDGSSLLTCGEDGAVKMWSRNGMLRSVLSQNGTPVYAVGWNADNGRIVYCCGENCFIKALKSQMSTIKWKAHDGIVLCLDWSLNTNLLITGGEDCKYKVWDGYGRQLFTSTSHDYPITSLAWNAEGDLFAVGSFNLLRLCDKAGWSHSLEKLATGSIFSLNWSPDSTQIVGGCANGHVIHAHIIERRVAWRNIEAVQSKRKSVDVRDVLSEVAREKLEMRDRITKLALGFEQLVVTTTKQCYIFRFFLLIDGGIIQIVTYEGRTQCTLTMPSSLNGDAISERTAAISNDTIAIRDRTDHKIINLFETLTAKSAGDGKIFHTNEIVEVAIDQCGMANERKVAFIDKSFDCFICLVKTYGVSQRIAKLGAMVTNVRFNDQTNMLAGLEDNRLVIWGYPSVVFVDKDLLQKTILVKEGTDFGRSPYLLASRPLTLKLNFHMHKRCDGLLIKRIITQRLKNVFPELWDKIQFIGNHVSVRRSDGSLVPCGVSPFPAALSAYIAASKWDQAIRLCRHIKEEYLWGMLAAMAANAKNFYAAEIAYGALDEAEKVGFLSELRTQPSKEIKMALMTAFTGNIHDADVMLQQTGHIFDAIMFNISLFRWQRALELAVKYKMHLDTVIGYRRKYLQETNRKETDRNFLQHLSEKNSLRHLLKVNWKYQDALVKERQQKNAVDELRNINVREQQIALRERKAGLFTFRLLYWSLHLLLDPD